MVFNTAQNMPLIESLTLKLTNRRFSSTVAAKLSDAFKQVLSKPEVRNRMVSQGADPAYLDSEAFTGFLKTETPRWEKAVKASGAKLD